MKLRDFLSSRDMSEAHLGRLLGVGQATVNRYIRGERIPRPVLMRRIVEVTKGEVGPADFYDLGVNADGSAEAATADPADVVAPQPPLALAPAEAG